MPPKKKAKVHLCTILPPQVPTKQYYLGNILLGKTNNMLPNGWKQCKVEFDNNDNLRMEFDSTILIVHVTEDLQLIESLFKTGGMFDMNFRKLNDTVSAELYLTQVPLHTFNKPIGKIIQTVFSRLFGIVIPNTEIPDQSNVNIKTVYKEAQSVLRGNTKIPERCVQHVFLKSTLKQYQEQAVRWMLLKETESNLIDTLHPLYQEVKLKTGTTIYFNKYNGYLKSTKPTVSNSRTGGILADEMGLGKSVEVLACILCHPKENTFSNSEELKILHQKKKLNNNKSNTPHKYKKLDNQCICGENLTAKAVNCKDCNKCQHATCLGYGELSDGYRCPQCWAKRPLLESKATLIVIPHNLKTQWKNEIRKHIDIHTNLKVLFYEGSTATHIPIYPTQLQDYDIVLTTYNVLKAELRHMESELNVTSRRQPAHYHDAGSPLARIKWWRLCLDEAQEVKSTTYKISEMAKTLQAHHRWAVTGTPVTRHISDLFGLIDFLEMEPYNEEETWTNILYNPYMSGNAKPMIQFLANIMWRSFEEDVKDQIRIKKQTIETYNLEFSPIEKHYYEREHERCADNFLTESQSRESSISLETLPKTDFNKLMDPLKSIRQACTHPDLTKKCYLTDRTTAGAMENVTDRLIKETINDGQKHLEDAAKALNGIGDINLLIPNIQEAQEAYKKVTELASGNIPAPILQKFHAFYNLVNVLQNPSTEQSSLDIQTLKKNLLTLEEKIINRSDRPEMRDKARKRISKCKEVPTWPSLKTTEQKHNKISELNEKWENSMAQFIKVQKKLEDLKKLAPSNSDCSKCKKALEDGGKRLTCGHRYCSDCALQLVKAEDNSLSCVFCVQLENVGEEDNGQNNSAEIKGKCSTKMKAIIEKIIELKNEDRYVKILVFSEWTDVLKMLHAALEDNDVKTSIALNPDMEKSLEYFKTPNVTALLLPIRLGSKGLNLIEATHVILVEPLLKPADELQAIGRVYRVGQTKLTFVHKFIMKNTIEQALHRQIISNADAYNEEKITIENLINLFTDEHCNTNAQDEDDADDSEFNHVDVENEQGDNTEEHDEQEIASTSIDVDENEEDIENEEDERDSVRDDNDSNEAQTSRHFPSQKRKIAQQENDSDDDLDLYLQMIKLQFKRIKNKSVIKKTQKEIDKLVFDAIYEQSQFGEHSGNNKN